MRRSTPTRFGPLLLLLCLPRLAAAEEIEPLPVDFLEYLANLESDDEDWTLFAEERGKKLPARRPDHRHRTPPPPANASEGDKP